MHAGPEVALGFSVSNAASSDCHECRITRPYKDAQNRLPWQDKTCPDLLDLAQHELDPVLNNDYHYDYRYYYNFYSYYIKLLYNKFYY